MARSTQGIIPDDHFENDPSEDVKNKSPLSQAWLDRIAAIKKRRENKNDDDNDAG